MDKDKVRQAVSRFKFAASSGKSSSEFVTVAEYNRLVEEICELLNLLVDAGS